MTRLTIAATRSLVHVAAAAAIACAVPGTAFAQEEGGLYIAGYRFSFERAAEQALERNPAGQRFFVLALPPRTASLTTDASRPDVAIRERVVAAGGVLLVCQRDVDRGKVDPAKLAPGVVAVRGFPPRGSDAIPPGERYYPDEDRGNLPADNNSLRRLRKACT